MADTWKAIVSLAARGGTWTARTLGPRRVAVKARTATGMPVEVILPEAVVRELVASLADVVAGWDETDAFEKRLADSKDS
jgi:hypothetical protein